MTEVEFYQLLQRYLDGRCTPEEAARVAQWYDQLDAAAPGPLASPEPTEVEAAIWQRLHRPAPTRPLPRLRPRWRQPALRWAAGLGLLAVGLGGALLPGARRYWAATTAVAPRATASSQTFAQQTITRHNTTPQVQILRLPDSSRVELQPGSTLHYATGLLGARREVHLEGAAFFKVHKNPRRPFLVFTSQVVTTVLGTSFDVQAYPGGAQALVAVREGKVSVQPSQLAQLDATPARPAKAGVLLLPNQQAVYSVASHRLIKELVPKPVLLTTQAFEFEERPVVEVLAALQKAYGVPLHYNRQRLAGCTVSITFYNESLRAKLDLLCKALGATYTLANGEVTIESVGCHGASPPAYQARAGT